MRKRSVLSMIMLLASSLAGAPAWAEAPELEVGPYLQQESPDSMLVTWISATPAIAWVRYGEKGQESRMARASKHGLVLFSERIHKVRLPQLKAGVEYSYTLHWQAATEKGDRRGEEMHAGPFHFSLAAANAPFTLMAFSDIHNNRRLLERLASHTQGDRTDMMVFVGDMMNYIGDEKTLIKDVLKPLTAVSGSAASLVWVRGNHETRGGFAYRMQDYVAMPAGRYYRAFQAGPVFWIVLDSGEDKVDDHVEYKGLADFDAYRAEEEHWLKQVLGSAACKAAPYRVVLVHNPPGSGYTGKAVARWSPLMNEAKVDLMICGHLHDGRIYPKGSLGLNFPIAQCGGRKMSDGAAFRMQFDAQGISLDLFHVDGRKLDSLEIKRDDLAQWVTN